jgi:hypothetical protein
MVAGASKDLDALNLWPAILAGGAGPRMGVVHQVENQYMYVFVLVFCADEVGAVCRRCVFGVAGSRALPMGCSIDQN